MKRGKFEMNGQIPDRDDTAMDKSNPGVEADSVDHNKHQTNWRKDILQYLHDLVYLMAVVLVVFLLCFRVVIVSGSSMNDTLIQGDYLLLISSTLYQNPKQGDIIVASKDSYKDGEAIVKRVIATEGQIVDINFKTGVVYVDGIALDEPYTKTSTNLQEGISFPLKVEEGCIFVMGDNRNISKDSRDPEIGLIDTREILGRAIFLFFPGAEENKNREFGRIGAIS